MLIQNRVKKDLCVGGKPLSFQDCSSVRISSAQYRLVLSAFARMAHHRLSHDPIQRLIEIYRPLGRHFITQNFFAIERIPLQDQWHACRRLTPALSLFIIGVSPASGLPR